MLMSAGGTGSRSRAFIVGRRSTPTTSPVPARQSKSASRCPARVSCGSWTARPRPADCPRPSFSKTARRCAGWRLTTGPIETAFAWPHSAPGYMTPEEFASPHRGHAPDGMTTSAKRRAVSSTRTLKPSERFLGAGQSDARTKPSGFQSAVVYLIVLGAGFGGPANGS